MSILLAKCLTQIYIGLSARSGPSCPTNNVNSHAGYLSGHLASREEIEHADPELAHDLKSLYDPPKNQAHVASCRQLISQSVQHEYRLAQRSPANTRLKRGESETNF